jgi:hypothetical protein
MDVAGFFESFYCCYVLEDVSGIRRGAERGWRKGYAERGFWSGKGGIGMEWRDVEVGMDARFAK